jgi:hypothetical protein
MRYSKPGSGIQHGGDGGHIGNRRRPSFADQMTKTDWTNTGHRAACPVTKEKYLTESMETSEDNTSASKCREVKGQKELKS